MQITSLYVSNFRGCREFHADNIPAGLLITGMNGAGKTSLLHAVQMTLFGRCYDQAGKRIMVADLVGHAGKEATVALTIGDTMLNFTVTAKGKTSLACKRTGKPDITGSPASVRTAFWATTDIDPTHAECAANPAAYLLSEDLSKLLAALGGGAIDKSDVIAMAKGYEDWLVAYVGLHGLDLTSLDGLDAVGDHVREARKELKKDINYINSKIEDEPLSAPLTADGETLAPSDIPAICQALDSLGTQRDGLIEEKGRASSGRSAEVINADATRLSVELGAAGNWADTARVEMDAAVRADADNTAHITECVNAASTARGTTALAQGEWKRAQMAIKEFENGVCPRCNSALAKKVIMALLKPAKADIKRIETEIEKLDTSINEVDDECAVAKAAKPGLAETVKAKTEAFNVVFTRQTAARLALESVQTEQPMTGNAGEITAQVSALDERIEKGTVLLTKLKSCVAANEYRKEIETKKAELVNLEWAVPFFEGTAQNAVSADGRATFIAKANETLLAFGYELSLKVEKKTVQVLLGKTGGPPVPISQISDGELLIAQVAVASMFSGDAPILIDALDGLDSGHKNNAMTMLIAARRSAWLAGAWSKGDPNEFLPDVADALRPAGLVWMAWNGIGSIFETEDVPQKKGATNEQI